MSAAASARAFLMLNQFDFYCGEKKYYIRFNCLALIAQQLLVDENVRNYRVWLISDDTTELLLILNFRERSRIVLSVPSMRPCDHPIYISLGRKSSERFWFIAYWRFGSIVALCLYLSFQLNDFEQRKQNKTKSVQISHYSWMNASHYKHSFFYSFQVFESVIYRYRNASNDGLWTVPATHTHQPREKTNRDLICFCQRRSRCFFLVYFVFVMTARFGFCGTFFSRFVRVPSKK